MRLMRVGDVLDTYALSRDTVGPYSSELSPRGIEDVLGTRRFGVIYRYLYNIPLAIFFQMEPPDDAPLAVRGPESVYGSVLVFGYDGSPRSLTDFEMNVLKQHTTMEKYDGEYTVILNDITKERTDVPIEIEEENE